MSDVRAYLALGDFCLCSGDEGVCLLSSNARNGLTDEPIAGGVTIDIPTHVAMELGSLLIEAGRARSN